MCWERKKAMEVVDDLWKKSSQYLNYYTSLDTRSFKNSEQSCRVHLYVLNALVELLESIDPELQQKYLAEEHALIQRYMSKGGTLGY